MKNLYCKECGEFLGEIEKGRIKKDAILLCRECADAYVFNYEKIKDSQADEQKFEQGEAFDYLKNILGIR